MADMTVSVGGIGGAVSAICSGYAREVESQAREDVDAAAEVALDSVKAGSPVDTGGYRRGWAVGDDSDGVKGYAVRVHNRKKPGLAHLLDKGHALVNGGFQPGDGHVAKAAEDGISELRRRVDG